MVMMTAMVITMMMVMTATVILSMMAPLMMTMTDMKSVRDPAARQKGRRWSLQSSPGEFT